MVYTRDATGNARLFVNAQEVVSGTIPGELSNWDGSYRLAFGNELTGDRPWIGTFDLVAIYGDALSHEEVGQNFRAGPGPARSQ